MRRYPGGGAFALFFHPHPWEFATQNKKSANARGLARGGGWAQLELTDALGKKEIQGYGREENPEKKRTTQGDIGLMGNSILDPHPPSLELKHQDEFKGRPSHT